MLGERIEIKWIVYQVSLFLFKVKVNNSDLPLMSAGITKQCFLYEQLLRDQGEKV